MNDQERLDEEPGSAESEEGVSERKPLRRALVREVGTEAAPEPERATLATEAVS